MDRLLIIDFGKPGYGRLYRASPARAECLCEISIPIRKVTGYLSDGFAPKPLILFGVARQRDPRGIGAPARSRFFAGRAASAVFVIGQQVMMELLGGKVESGHAPPEFGPRLCDPLNRPVDLLNGWFLEEREQVLDELMAIMSGKMRRSLPFTGTSPKRHLRSRLESWSGVSMRLQFHPEVHPPPNGKTHVSGISSVTRAVPATGRWGPTVRRRSAKNP